MVRTLSCSAAEVGAHSRCAKPRSVGVGAGELSYLLVLALQSSKEGVKLVRLVTTNIESGGIYYRAKHTETQSWLQVLRTISISCVWNPERCSLAACSASQVMESTKCENSEEDISPNA